MRTFFLTLLFWCICAITFPSRAVLTPSVESSFNKDSLAKAYNNSAVAYALQGDYVKADELLIKSLKVKESIPDYPRHKLANGYINLAVIKMKLLYYDSAFYYFNISEKVLAGIEDSHKSLLAGLYIEKGNCYRYISAYSDALLYIGKGIELLMADSMANINILIPAYIKLTAVHLKSGSNQKSLKAAQKAYSLSSRYNKSFLFYTSYGLGNCYHIDNNFQKAIDLYSIALAEAQKIPKFNPTEMVGIYNSLAMSHWMISQHSVAEKYFDQGLAVDSKTSNTVILLRNYAKFCLANSQFDKAESLYNQSISLNQKLPNSSDSSYLNRYFQPLLASQCFSGLGELYYKKFTVNPSHVFAAKSFAYFQESVEIINQFTQDFINDDDKLLLSENYHSTFLKAVQSLMLFSNHDSKYVDYAFGLMSRSKASVLQQAISRDGNLKYSNVPDNLVAKEREMSQRVFELREKITEGITKGSKNQEIRFIEDQLFNAQREHSSLVSDIERNFPDYFSLKFDKSAVTIGQVQQKLKPSQVLIDYLLTDSVLISIAISRETTEWRFQKVGLDFFENIATFTAELNPAGFDNLNRTNLTNFTSSSFYLYQQLIEPYRELIGSRELVIIPHGKLSSIPFSALISHCPDNIRGYYSLPYLVLSTPISYYPSSKIFVQAVKNSPALYLNAVSFAPTYNQLTDSLKSLPYRQNLVDLPGAEMEAKAVVNIFGGKSFLGNSATEGCFKGKASLYDVIHLAMHTFVNESNHLYSKLVFAHQSDSQEDGLLNMYEIYGLRLPVKLAVISACRSGDGSLIGGEGLLSLARSFQYAGCPSLVAALWRVDDYSGQQIMVDFSKNVNSGKSVSTALQLAQVNFIQNADPLRSHPYFWASYQLIGSSSALSYTKSFKIILWSVLSFAVLFILFAGFQVTFRKKWLKRS